MIYLILPIIVSILLEAYFSTFPFALILIIFSAALGKPKDTLALAFFGGLLLDFLSFRSLGVSSVFFLILSFLILTYQKKLEANSAFFISIFTFIGSFIYLLILGSANVFLISFLASIISVSIFLVYGKSRRSVLG